MVEKHKLVALLPIKRNSERVKGKNFRQLGNKPLFRWILDELLKVQEIDLLVINTDAPDMFTDDVIRNSDRVVIRERPPELCGDMVSMNLILESDMRAYPSAAYLMTHATNPFLTSNSLREAYGEFQSQKEFDSMFSVNRIQTRFYREDGSAVNHDPNNLIRTQDLELWYEENSCFYYFTEESFRRTGARIGSKPKMFETSVLESFDIDDKDDWVISEAYANYLLEKNQ